MRTVYFNASVYTGELPLAEAFGVEEDVFFFTGTNADAIYTFGFLYSPVPSIVHRQSI